MPRISSMNAMKLNLLSLGLVLGAQCAASAQHLIVPAAYSVVDGPSSGALAGVSLRGRQQVLIGASHLSAAAGKTITGLWFRRDAGTAGTLQGGTASWLLRMSETAVIPARAEREFALNHGPAVTTCFVGSLSIPTSPPPGVDPWAADQTLRVPFSNPLGYAGANLCIELEAAPGLVVSDRWPVDCAYQVLDGSAVSVGTHCSALAEIPAGQALATNVDTLALGATSRFSALGRFGTPVALLLGAELMGGVDLSTIGMTGCVLRVQSSAVLTSILTDRPVALPNWAAAGSNFEIQIPFTSSLLAGSFMAQAVNLETGGQTSNPFGVVLSQGLRCTLASVLPTLDMALVDCNATDSPAPLPTQGVVVNNRAPVLKLLYH